ncbi:MAG: hypothetical protein V9G19_15135 [Tetrasphaera sp.]
MTDAPQDDFQEQLQTMIEESPAVAENTESGGEEPAADAADGGADNGADGGAADAGADELSPMSVGADPDFGETPRADEIERGL